MSEAWQARQVRARVLVVIIIKRAMLSGLCRSTARPLLFFVLDKA